MLFFLIKGFQSLSKLGDASSADSMDSGGGFLVRLSVAVGLCYKNVLKWDVI